jgi:hypothetical protein
MLLLRFIFEYVQGRQIVIYLLKCRQDCLPIIGSVDIAL